MDVRNLATFAADFPEPEEYRADGELVPAGRIAAEAIAGALQEEVKLPRPVVRQYSSYGWEFQYGSYWCLLQCPDTWLLIVEDRSSVLGRWVNRRKTASAFQAFLEATGRALEADGRFSDIRWLSRREYEGSGGGTLARAATVPRDGRRRR